MSSGSSLPTSRLLHKQIISEWVISSTWVVLVTTLICLVSSLQHYLSVRSLFPSPLFISSTVIVERSEWSFIIGRHRYDWIPRSAFDSNTGSQVQICISKLDLHVVTFTRGLESVSRSRSKGNFLQTSSCTVALPCVGVVCCAERYVLRRTRHCRQDSQIRSRLESNPTPKN